MLFTGHSDVNWIAAAGNKTIRQVKYIGDTCRITLVTIPLAATLYKSSPAPRAQQLLPPPPRDPLRLV